MMPTIRPLRPSAPIRERYERAIDREIDRMAASLRRWLSAAYRASPPHALVLYAADASPARIMQAAMRTLSRRWLKRFDTLAERLAARFATDVRDRNDRSLRDDLRLGGFSVRFKMTAAMNDAFQAVRAENVALIKSIAQQHLAQVETLVMQSVSAGRDLATLVNGLEKRTGVTRRRAKAIALDQNNKATAVMARARYLELGVKRAKWLHSAGGFTPRKEHLAFTGQTFDVAKGHDFENGEGIVWPGTAINCRCVMAPVIPGFDT